MPTLKSRVTLNRADFESLCIRSYLADQFIDCLHNFESELDDLLKSNLLDLDRLFELHYNMLNLYIELKNHSNYITPVDSNVVDIVLKKYGYEQKAK